MPELMGISHIDLAVSAASAAAWWQDVVGFTPVNRTSGETFETGSLVHPSGIAVAVMTHDATRKPVRSIKCGASSSSPSQPAVDLAVRWELA
jgi:hypothetical protein